MTAEELTAWALRSGWQMLGGHPSLTRASQPKTAIVRLVLKATVAHVEAKKPAGKWEKLTGGDYDRIVMNEDTELPDGLGLETIPGIRMLMQENKDRLMMARLGGG
jgi:hypothetical protein